MRITSRVLAFAAVLVGTVAQAPVASADYGIDPPTYSFTAGDSSPAGGSHPDVQIGFHLNKKDPAGDAALEFPDFQTYGPDGSTRALDVALPPGLVADPTVAPTCTPGRIFANEDCPPEAAVGELSIVLYTPPGVDSAPGTPGSYLPGLGFGFERTRLWRIPTVGDEVAAFQGALYRFPFRVSVTVGPDGGYRIRAQAKNLNEVQALMRVGVTLWGIPADHQGPPTDPNSFIAFGGPLEGAPRRAFTSLPSACTGQPLSVDVALRSWQSPDYTVPLTAQGPTLSACDQQPFEPSIDVRPTTGKAGAPAGYDVDLSLPQPWTAPVGEGETPVPATAHLKDVTVALPEGVAISPSAAHGLGACSDEQLAIGSNADETCPDSSKIGTVRLETPILEDAIPGTIYLGTQRSQDPTSGEMYRVFFTATRDGVKVKLRGSIKANPATGQLTATFLDNPQLPFSRLSLRFKDGDRAPLVNPTTCGTKTTNATLSSWAGQTREGSSSFTIDQDCPAGGFSPGFNAGTVNPLAGTLSPFTTNISRNDGDQDLKRIHLDLPSGLLGALGKVPVCGDAQAAAGTCAPDTRLGSSTVAVGTGATPFSLPGTVSLGGPYKGAPFSLSIAVPAKAGPLDLGLVVVRSPLVVDANNARVSAPVDDLPQIVGGVPLHYRSINVTLDRPGFMFNATNCDARTISGTLTSVGGAVARPSAGYQAQGCDKLKLSPSIRITYSGKSDLKKDKNPKLTADLGQTFGQAGLRRVKVTLPRTSSLRAANAKALCTPAEAAARACPAGSIVGRASATTPALHEALTGPVYFVQGTRKTASGKTVAALPKLWLKLAGDGVPLDLWAASSTDNATGRLVATFTDIPDAPIADFKLEIFGGKNGILAAPRDPCTSDRRADVQFDGQNGGRQIRSLNIAAPECGVRASMNASASRVRFGFSGVGAGKVSVSGKGLIATSRTVKGEDRVTVTANLTASVRRQIASGRTVRLRLTAKFDPKAKGKTTAITKTVTIKGAAKRR